MHMHMHMYSALIRISPAHPCLQDRDALGWLLSAVPELLLADRVGYVYTRAMQSQSSERARLAGSSGSRRVESFEAALQRWKALEEVRVERWMAMVEGLKAMLGRWEKAEEMQRQQAPRLSAYQCFARATRLDNMAKVPPMPLGSAPGRLPRLLRARPAALAGSALSGERPAPWASCHCLVCSS